MKRGGRRDDLDWLRTLASSLVVIYHTAQFFDLQEKTYIKNGELSWTMDLFTRFVYIWHMPLFFLLAGWSARASLAKRGAWVFLLERVQKLLIPLLFGLFFWCAFPRWVELKRGLFKTSSGEKLPAQPAVSFTAFLQEYYYTGGAMTWGHLWFLAYLFTFTVLYLPGFLFLSRTSFVEKWLYGWGGWVVENAPVVLLVVIQVSLRDRWPGFQNLTDDWANFWFYSTFFVTGFCLAQYPALETHLNASWRMNFVIGIMSSVLCLISSPLFGSPLKSVYSHVFSALGAWYMVLSLLSYARHAFSGRAPPLVWASHAFSVYILHDVPLAILADGLLPSWGAPILVKFVVLGSSALILTHLLLLKHFALLAILVGQKEPSAIPSTKKGN
ncbi:unnamed protein product [Calypogeia fissa]